MKSGKIWIKICIFFLAILAVKASNAQDVEARIRVFPEKILVEGRFLSESAFSKSRSWSFLESYADAEKLGARFSNLALFDRSDSPIGVKEFVPGEFEAAFPAASFKYEVRLQIPDKITSTAHISWLGENHGLLMPNDIFPQWQAQDGGPIRARLSFDIPGGWRIFGNDKRESGITFIAEDMMKSVFLVGTSLREKRIWVGKNELNLAIAGEWKFSDEDAVQIASDILQEHQRTFGEPASAKSQVFLMPFPKGTFIENWRAETRGSTVTIISGAMPFRQSALQRLHEQMRHEILHFWMPNNLSLTGNYDWYYEGFSIYQALRTGIRLNFISFNDFLDTLSRTYEVTNAFDSEKVSLIQASQNRWRGYTSLVYNKGVMAAFLCDMAILRESKGKRNISDVLKQVWQSHKAGKAPQDGNSAIINILKGYPELSGIIRDHIEGSRKISLEKELMAFGIEMERSEYRIQMKVLAKLNGRQKDLLDKLGYNQWRKISAKSE